MELRQLQYFLAVVEELNISAAARKLNLTQPALSRQIKALEAKIGSLEVPKEVPAEGSKSSGKRREEIDDLVSEEREVSSDNMPTQGEYQAGTDRVERFIAGAADR